MDSEEKFLALTFSKRERSNNFTQEEVDILKSLVEANKDVLENMKSDGTTWKQKNDCWKAIEKSFNAVSGSTHRTLKTLRIKYEGMKRDKRKKKIAEINRTGAPTTAPILTPPASKLNDEILKMPLERKADPMEITLLQKKILEEEYRNKKLQWAFEEEERQHKKEMWALEKKLLLKKINS